jgi:hypothetical protein
MGIERERNMRTPSEIRKRIDELTDDIKRRQTDIEAELDERVAMAILHYIHRVEDKIGILRWVLDEEAE